MDKQKLTKTALGGIVENPVFVLVLGMCPVLGTSTLEGALILGIATLAVLVFSNLLISALRKLIPDKVRIPCYIVIIATLVTIVDMFLAHFMDPNSYTGIRMYISLIVVNCIVLGRAEAFAAKNNPLYSMLDGLSMGLGFTVALSLYGAIRELLATGKLYGAVVIPDFGIEFFGKAAGGLILLGLLMALFNFVYTQVKQHARSRSVAAALAGNTAANEQVQPLPVIADEVPVDVQEKEGK